MHLTQTTAGEQNKYMIYVPKHYTFTSVIFVKHFYADFEARVNVLHPSYNLQYYSLGRLCVLHYPHACGFTRHESCAMQVKRMVMIQLINKVFKQYLSNLSS